jgi:hypothetical protein
LWRCGLLRGSRECDQEEKRKARGDAHWVQFYAREMTAE